MTMLLTFQLFLEGNGQYDSITDLISQGDSIHMVIVISKVSSEQLTRIYLSM